LLRDVRGGGAQDALGCCRERRGVVPACSKDERIDTHAAEEAERSRLQ
jgi:hypothetical protein